MTTSNKSAAFGNLLKGAISGIANYEGKTAPVIEEELGALIGVSGKTIQRYKTGYLPPFDRDNDAVRVLAEAAVRRGFLGREWLERFLHAARYPAAEKLVDELCPTPTLRPKPERIYENLPAPTYDQFVMRQQAFDEVIDGLSQRSAAVLIVGMGGNGKTSLAREVATHCLQPDTAGPHFDAAVWISDKDNPGTTNQSTVLDTIARTLDYPGFTQCAHDEKQYEVEQLLRRQKVLLIIDNAETITDSALFTWLLRLPEPSKAIITTREYHRLLRRNTTPVELRGMSEEEARTLLQQRLERLRIAHLVHNQTQLEPLVAATGGNPKAITMVAGLLKHERRPLQQIVDDLYAARGDLFDDLFSRAWALLDEAGKRILMVMTFFPDSASTDALSATADVTGFDFDRAAERLTDLSLLDVQQEDLTSEPRYVLHPLVRAFAVARLTEQPEFEKAARERWSEWYVELASRVGYCWDDPAKLSLLDSDNQTIQAAVKWCTENQNYASAVQIAHDAYYYYCIRGLWEKLIQIMQLGVDAASQLNDPSVEIKTIAKHIQMICRAGHVPEDVEFISQMSCLADALSLELEVLFEYHFAIFQYWMAHQNLAAAENVFRSALTYTETSCLHNHVIAQQWLGICLYRQERWLEAQQFLRAALQVSIEISSELDVVFCRIFLAAIELDQGDVTTATELLEGSIDIAHVYQDRESIALIYHLQARLHTLRGELPEAYASLTEAIDLFERMGMRRELAEAREELARLEAQMAEAAE